MEAAFQVASQSPHRGRGFPFPGLGPPRCGPAAAARPAGETQSGLRSLFWSACVNTTAPLLQMEAQDKGRQVVSARAGSSMICARAGQGAV